MGVWPELALITRLLRALREMSKKETGRCPGGNMTGSPRLGVCGGSPGRSIPPTVNNLDGSMDQDGFKLRKTLSQLAFSQLLV